MTRSPLTRARPPHATDCSCAALLPDESCSAIQEHVSTQDCIHVSTHASVHVGPHIASRRTFPDIRRDTVRRSRHIVTPSLPKHVNARAHHTWPTKNTALARTRKGCRHSVSQSAGRRGAELKHHLISTRCRPQGRCTVAAACPSERSQATGAEFTRSASEPCNEQKGAAH